MRLRLKMPSPGFHQAEGPGWAHAGVRTASAAMFSRRGSDVEEASAALRDYLERQLDVYTEALGILDEGTP